MAKRVWSEKKLWRYKKNMIFGFFFCHKWLNVYCRNENCDFHVFVPKLVCCWFYALFQSFDWSRMVRNDGFFSFCVLQWMENDLLIANDLGSSPIAWRTIFLPLVPWGCMCEWPIQCHFILLTTLVKWCRMIKILENLRMTHALNHFSTIHWIFC